MARPRNRRPPEPATALLSSSNARLASARRLTRRKDRRETGRFLAEGAQAVRAALTADAVLELFATADAAARHPELTVGASEISERDAASLSETSTPQGLIAVCAIRDHTLERILAAKPRLLTVLVEPSDPGNVGTIIRTSDAAGADAVVLDSGVDPYNGKVVRASAGSVFHLPVLECETQDLLARTDQIGMTAIATSIQGDCDLDELIDAGLLAAPTVWLLGNEAHGLPDSVVEAADHRVRIPIYGRAESLNLAAAAAVCLYASARAHRGAGSR